MITLIHCTNYHGYKLKTSYIKTDQESGANAIWFQVCLGFSSNAKACCKGFGDRQIRMTPNWFAGWLSSTGRLRWNIYKVSKRQGNNPRHQFSKFIIVEDDHNFDAEAEYKLNCVRHHIKSHEVWQNMEAIAFEEMNLNNNSIFNHVHVGLVGTPNLRITR